MKKGELIQLRITDYAFGGKGIAKVDDGENKFVYFIENTIPGQLVEAQIVKKRKRYAECRLINIIERSPDEVEIPYQAISGSPYITLPIEKQESYKKDTVLELFKRIGHIDNVDSLFDTFLSSPSHWFYRNKMEYSFSSICHNIETDEEYDGFGLGFKRRGTWWKVENLDKASGLFDEEFETKLKEIRLWCEATGLPAWHPPRKTGFFRHIVVRKSFASNQLLVHLVTSSEGLKKFDLNGFKDKILSLFGNRIAGLQHTVNDNVADRAKIENGNTTLLHGEDVIIEKLLGLSFEISMESFFQTNPMSAEKLYSKVIDYALEDNSVDDEVVMDLFCGTGTIGQILASRTNNTKIIGVDIVEEAIENAKRNAKLNGIEDVEFYAADVGKFLLEYPEYEGKISTIVLDPPRGGIAPKTLRKVMRLGAKRIVYVSCNPSTQARDLIALDEFGYQLNKFTLVDQFPHTAHIESIALLEKK